jgi:hypothetical protein
VSLTTPQRKNRRAINSGEDYLDFPEAGIGDHQQTTHWRRSFRLPRRAFFCASGHFYLGETGHYYLGLTVTDEQVQMTVDRLNHRPRKVLGFRTPHEVSFGVEIIYTKQPLAVALLH